MDGRAAAHPARESAGSSRWRKKCSGVHFGDLMPIRASPRKAGRGARVFMQQPLAGKSQQSFPKRSSSVTLCGGSGQRRTKIGPQGLPGKLQRGSSSHLHLHLSVGQPGTAALHHPARDHEVGTGCDTALQERPDFQMHCLASLLPAGTSVGSCRELKSILQNSMREEGAAMRPEHSMSPLCCYLLGTLLLHGAAVGDRGILCCALQENEVWGRRGESSSCWRRSHPRPISATAQKSPGYICLL